jgi:hypothetical protein
MKPTSGSVAPAPAATRAPEEYPATALAGEALPGLLRCCRYGFVSAIVRTKGRDTSQPARRERVRKRWARCTCLRVSDACAPHLRACASCSARPHTCISPHGPLSDQLGPPRARPRNMRAETRGLRDDGSVTMALTRTRPTRCTSARASRRARSTRVYSEHSAHPYIKASLCAEPVFQTADRDRHERARAPVQGRHNDGRRHTRSVVPASIYFITPS